MHVGRSWEGHPVEDECPCPKAGCGLVVFVEASPDCREHGFESGKTLRQSHREDQCPAVKADGYADRLQDAIFSRWFDPIGGAA